MTSTMLSACQSAGSLFRNEVKERMQTETTATKVIGAADLQHLPAPVARYLTYCGWVGKSIPRNFYLKFRGRFSRKERKYMKVTSEQYNWTDGHPTRIFHMSNGLFSGRHRYDERGAIMLIKLLGRFKIAYAEGPEMDKAELVTYLNDLCIIAPGALIDAPIHWENIDELSVKATISQYGQTISASIYFNEKGELINFISNDRYATSGNGKSENIPWSTPMYDYQEIKGIKVPSYGEAIWHYPDRDFVYAKLYIEAADWNVQGIVK